MEKFGIIVTAIKDVVIILITVIGFVHAYKQYMDKERKKIEAKKDSVRINLAEDVYALYFVEKEAIAQIAVQKGTSEAQVKKELRDAAEKRSDNHLHLRPSKRVSLAKNYLP